MIITEGQLTELEQLSSEMADVFVSYGRDMYHEGAIHGAFAGIVGVVCGYAAKSVFNIYKQWKSETGKEEES